MRSWPLRIALLQTAPVIEKVEAALAVLDEAAGRAAKTGAAILVTPEMYLTGYAIGVEALQRLAEAEDGPVWEAVGGIAKRHRIALLCGGPKRSEDGGIYNTVQFRGPEGALLKSYQKTHLFGDVDRRQFKAGNALSNVLDFEGWALGFAICYDIEFPEVARALALRGVDAILVPTANMVPFDSVATRLVPARSEENGVYVAYANYCGADAAFDYCGLSCLTGPDGQDIARAGRGPELITADLSKDALAQARQAATYLADRRGDLYTDNDDQQEKS